MSITFIVSKLKMIGLDGHNDPEVPRKASLKVISLSTLFCKVSILFSSVLNVDPQTSIAHII